MQVYRNTSNKMKNSMKGKKHKNNAKLHIDDIIVSQYLTEYYLIKHKRTFKKIENDVLKKAKAIMGDRLKNMTGIYKVNVKPYIEIISLTPPKDKGE